MALRPRARPPFGPPWRLSARLRWCSWGANLSEKPSEALQNALRRRILLSRLPGQRVILDQVTAQEEPPLCQADQHRPSVTALCGLEAGQRPIEVLLAETKAGLHEPAVLVPMPQVFQLLVSRLLMRWWLVAQPEGR